MQGAGLLLWMLVCAILVLDIGDACVHAQDSSSRIKAQEFDIVNSSGVTVIELMGDSDGPTIELCDPSGEARMIPSAGGFGAGIDFLDTGLNSTAALGSINIKGSLEDALHLHGQDQVSANLYLQSFETGMSIRDNAGKERAVAIYHPDGDFAEVGTECAKDETAVTATICGKLAHMTIDDPKGAPRADFGLETNNNAYFALAGKKGNANWDKTYDADGSPTAFGGGAGGSNESNGGASDSLRHNGSS